MAEEHPELVLDDIERDLTSAHRPLDEAHNEIAGIVEQELITRPGRNLFKGDKGVGTHCVLIADCVRVQQPLGLNKKFIDTIQQELPAQKTWEEKNES